MTRNCIALLSASLTFMVLGAGVNAQPATPDAYFEIYKCSYVADNGLDVFANYLTPLDRQKQSLFDWLVYERWGTRAAFDSWHQLILGDGGRTRLLIRTRAQVDRRAE